MKARRLLYWLGLVCMVGLVLMPDITVNAQPDPGEQDSDGQIPNEVEGEGPDTQTSEEQLTSAGQEPSKKQPQPMIEPFLIQSGCEYVGVEEYGLGRKVFNVYKCTPGRIDDHYSAWACLVTPETPDDPWPKRGECVDLEGQPAGGILQENGGAPRPITIKKIAEPASSDSQGESDQQQANGEEVAQVDEEAGGEEAGGEEAGGEEAGGEEAGGEENNASNQSQANNSSKQGYGCSANP